LELLEPRDLKRATLSVLSKPGKKKIGFGAIVLRLMLLPFLVIQLLAPGTMPTRGPDGLAVVLCTGNGLVEVVIGSDGVPRPVAPDGDKHPAPCSWAMAAHAFVDTLAPAAPLPSVAFEHIEPFVTMEAVAGVSPVLLPPTRAPPAIV
jgi:hypothetical protein